MNGKILREKRNKLKLTQTQLAEKLGVSMRTIQNWEGDVNTIPKSVELFLESEEFSYSENVIETKIVEEDNIERIEGNRKTKDALFEMQTIPVYDAVATLGLVEVFKGTEKGNVMDYISIPNLPKSDGAIFMTGDSMYPLLKSGDIVALKIIHRDDIIFGEMYYVEYLGSDYDSEFKVIKYVKRSEKGDDYIQLVSYNQHHQPIDILKNKIKTVAIVNASVRYNRL